MTCRIVKVGESVAIVCGPRPRRQKCSSCGAGAGLLCDWKLGGGKTCDKPICRACAMEVEPEKHLCREHQAAYREWSSRRAGAPP